MGRLRECPVSIARVSFKDRQVTDLDTTDLVFFGPRILFCVADALWGEASRIHLVRFLSVWALFWADRAL